MRGRWTATCGAAPSQVDATPRSRRRSSAPSPWRTTRDSPHASWSRRRSGAGAGPLGPGRPGRLGHHVGHRRTDDPRASATAMIDGDPGTTWYARPGDIHPELQVNFLGVAAPSVASPWAWLGRHGRSGSRSPWSSGGRVAERTVELGKDGAASFAPIITSQLRVEVRRPSQRRTSTSTVARAMSPSASESSGWTGCRLCPLALVRARAQPWVRHGSRDRRERPRAQLVRHRESRASGDRASRSRRASAPTEVAPVRRSITRWPCGRRRLSCPESLVLGGDSPVKRSRGYQSRQTIRTVPRSAGVDYLVYPREREPGMDGRQRIGDHLEDQVFDGWRQGWRQTPRPGRPRCRSARTGSTGWGWDWAWSASWCSSGRAGRSSHAVRSGAAEPVSRSTRRHAGLARRGRLTSVLLLGWTGGLVALVAVMVPWLRAEGAALTGRAGAPALLVAPA